MLYLKILLGPPQTSPDSLPRTIKSQASSLTILYNLLYTAVMYDISVATTTTQCRRKIASQTAPPSSSLRQMPVRPLWYPEKRR